MSLKVCRALISVSDKTGVIELGQALATAGVEILSTGGTFSTLQNAGIVVEVSAHRLSGDDGWPREDAASENSRRDFGAARY